MKFDNQKLIHIAYTIKPHGLNGYISIKLISGFLQEILIKDKPVFLYIQGIPVPFCLEDKKQAGAYIAIKLKLVKNNEDAQKYQNCNVYIFESELEQSNSDSDNFDLIDYAVYDKNHGFIGNIINFIDIPNNPVIETQFDDKTITLPYNDKFIININHNNKSINISTPKGLIDIYLT